MDYKRIIIYAALAIVGMSLWNAWQADNARRKASAATAVITHQQSASESVSGVPQAALNAIPTADAAKQTTSTPSSPAVPTAVKAIPKKRLITLRAEHLCVSLSFNRFSGLSRFKHSSFREASVNYLIADIRRNWVSWEVGCASTISITA